MTHTHTLSMFIFVIIFFDLEWTYIIFYLFFFFSITDWQAWAKAGQDLISRAFPVAQHIVVNTADRNMPLTAPEAVVEQVLKLVRHWRLKQPPAAQK